jgi:hypothetical protein
MTHTHLNRFLLIIFFLFSVSGTFAADITISSQSRISILYDKTGTLDSISAHLLRQDISSVTGYQPAVLTDAAKASGTVIVIGGAGSGLMQQVAPQEKAFLASLSGKWECYGLKIVNNPVKNIRQALLIAGSDPRGTAYGVFSISEKIGVSPWYWWADVQPVKKNAVKISVTPFVSAPPSVKYRGIFLNDEDWGLQPWAAKTFEPETGDIGPKTYAKIFELLLRLKANLIWPAMHPSTKAFYSYPGNAKVAAAYHIVIGSSHAEPMLRNNVGEWNEKTMGAFNYLTNKDRVFSYWEQRVKESSTNDAIYTIGMRGVHDSGMEGVKSPKEAVPLLERIFEDQRNLLRKYRPGDVTKIPQVFTAYKEVLDIYDSGLKLPDDVTLVWPDDNYGYIQRLNNTTERARSGGSGVYYHASYWGRPHDYLWISSTNPALIREEMMKAYENGTNTLWVLNVGDLKPIEYNMQLFLDMAYSATPFNNPDQVYTHLMQFATKTFGQTYGNPIASVWKEYYRLAFERRPEFMGWSQTEPTTQTKYTDYNHFYYGDEAQKRIDAYNRIEAKVKALRKLVPQKDAFYELVYYPVTGAAWMNKKFLYRDKAHLYAQQNRLSAFDYARESKLAYDSIKMETEYFNQKLAGGKWKNMMSMEPRGLPVYKEPVIEAIKIDSSGKWGVAPEGPASGITISYSKESTQNLAFIDVFLSANQTVQWAAQAPPGVKLSKINGTLSPAGQKEIRLWISIDPARVPAARSSSAQISIFSADRKISIPLTLHSLDNLVATGFKGMTSKNGLLATEAVDYSRVSGNPGDWKAIAGLNQSGAAALAAPAPKDSLHLPAVEYDFYISTAYSPAFSIYTLPTLPLNNECGMRYKISVDNGPEATIDFKTVGRSEEWKQNVLRNSAIRTWTAQPLQAGKHTLKIRPLDPGIIFQRILSVPPDFPKPYSYVTQTKSVESNR